VPCKGEILNLSYHVGLLERVLIIVIDNITPNRAALKKRASTLLGSRSHVIYDAVGL
jgi:hypothetical protein